MEKRLIIAVVLSVSVIAGYQLLMNKLYPRQQIEQTSLPIEFKQGETIREEMAKPLSSEAVLSLDHEEKTVINTDKYSVTLSNVGGCITEIKLNEFKEKGEPLILTKSDFINDRIFSLTGLDDLLDAKFQLKKTDLTLTYSRKINEKLEVIKKYSFHKDKYGIDLEIFFNNLQSTPLKISYDIVGASNIEVSSKFDARYLSSSAKINDKTEQLKNKKDVAFFKGGNISWEVLSGRYFSLILKPFSPNSGAFSRSSKSGQLIIGIKAQEFEVQPNSSISNKYFLYAGPNDVNILKSFNLGLEDTINYGFFDGISKILLKTLRFLHKIFPNWGVAIILLSLLIGLVLSPLSITSYKSMKKLQMLQPHMEKLKKEHKDNPQKFQKEMMELYKKHKVNPMGGCLPMVLQMPIFFALYNALIKSIELKGARFLWAPDLSMPDAVKIPFSLPLIGNSINVLPILMIGAMFLQQKMSITANMGQSEEQMQQQKMMLILMPVIFGVILYNFPAGLVLYWLTNTIFTLIQQKMIMRSV